jgi:hypothetical protein
VESLEGIPEDLIYRIYSYLSPDSLVRVVASPLHTDSHSGIGILYSLFFLLTLRFIWFMVRLCGEKRMADEGPPLSKLFFLVSRSAGNKIPVARRLNIRYVRNETGQRPNQK